MVPDALLELGEVHETGRPDGARLPGLQAAPGPGIRAGPGPRAGPLAAGHAYAAENFLVSARDTIFNCSSGIPGSGSTPRGRRLPLADLVNSELARPPLAQIAADRPRPPVPFPLMRQWQLRAPSTRTVRVVTALGMPPGLHTSRTFLVEGTKLSPLDPASGQPRWSVDMGAPTTGSATSPTSCSPRLPSGWSPSSSTAGPSSGVSPRDRGGGRAAGRTRSPAPSPPQTPRRRHGACSTISSWSAVDCSASGAKRNSLALDGDTGAVDWSFSPRGTPINPKFWIGPERVVLQVHSPNQLLVLETDSGTQVARTPWPKARRWNVPPVPIDEDHVLLVTDRRTVKKFDLTRGQFTWDYRESGRCRSTAPHG